MSALGSILNTALRSLEANQLALSVASNNIANAQTPGYSRERLITRPAASGGDPLPIAMGVDVVRVEALRSELIENRLQQETSRKSEDETLNRTLGDIEVLFNESDDSGLLPGLTKFFNSFHALSTDPTSLSLREEVKTNARILADSFSTRGTALEDLQRLTDQQIASDVATINNLTNQIASITQLIAEQEIHHPANELRDQRAILVRELSHIADVKELESGHDYQLTLGGNRLLVLNRDAMQLTTDRDASTGFLIVRSGQDDITGEVESGALQAKIALRDQYIPRYADALDQLAYEITQNVNSIHGSAYDLDGNTGINFFSPMTTSAGAARSMALSTDVAGSARRIAVALQTAGKDNGAALQLGNLLHQQVFSGGSVTDQYRNLVFAIGSDASNAGIGFREHEALEHQLESRRNAISGVSIDEETVQMLQFQRAYEASARLVRTVDELLQVVLGMGA